MPPPDALSIAMMGPMRRREGDVMESEDESGSASDAEIVAADVFSAIESKDARGLVDALRNLMDVMHAEREESE